MRAVRVSKSLTRSEALSVNTVPSIRTVPTQQVDAPRGQKAVRCLRPQPTVVTTV